MDGARYIAAHSEGDVAVQNEQPRVNHQRRPALVCIDDMITYHDMTSQLHTGVIKDRFISFRLSPSCREAGVDLVACNRSPTSFGTTPLCEAHTGQHGPQPYYREHRQLRNNISSLCRLSRIARCRSRFVLEEGLDVDSCAWVCSPLSKATVQSVWTPKHDTIGPLRLFQLFYSSFESSLRL